jgi:hypothetical protein
MTSSLKLPLMRYACLTVLAMLKMSRRYWKAAVLPT